MITKIENIGFLGDPDKEKGYQFFYNYIEDGKFKQSRNPGYRGSSVNVNFAALKEHTIVDFGYSTPYRAVFLTDKGEVYGTGIDTTPSKTKTVIEKISIPGDEKVKKIVLSNQSSSFHVLTNKGEVYGIGFNGKKQLGVEKGGTHSIWKSPVIPSSAKIVDLHASSGTYLAKMSDGTFYSWGISIGVNNRSEGEMPTKLSFKGIEDVEKLIPTVGSTLSGQSKVMPGTTYAIGKDKKLYTLQVPENPNHKHGHVQDVNLCTLDPHPINKLVSEVYDIQESNDSAIIRTDKGIFLSPKHNTECQLIDGTHDVELKQKYEVSPKSVTFVGTDCIPHFGSGGKAGNKESFYFDCDGEIYTWQRQFLRRQRSKDAPLYEYSETATKDVAMKTLSMLSYPESFIANTLC